MLMCVHVHTCVCGVCMHACDLHMMCLAVCANTKRKDHELKLEWDLKIDLEGSNGSRLRELLIAYTPSYHPPHSPSPCCEQI